MHIGAKIKQIRKEKNISQLELAKNSGISNTYLSDLEVGRSNPSIKTLQKIAKSLEVDITLLLK